MIYMTLEDPIRYIYNDLEEHIEVFTQLQEAKYLKTLESIAQRLIEMYELFFLSFLPVLMKLN